MLKIKVTEKSGASIEYQGDESLIAKLSEMGHGKPERVVLHKDELGAEPYDDADVLEELQVEIKASPVAPPVIQKQVKLRSEYTVEVEDVSAQHSLAECYRNRKAEYPTAEDFLNAYFDGGPTALEALHEIRLLVKAKYPKPGI